MRILYKPGQEVEIKYNAVETQRARVKAHLRLIDFKHNGDGLAEQGHQGSHRYEIVQLNDKLTENGVRSNNYDFPHSHQ